MWTAGFICDLSAAALFKQHIQVFVTWLLAQYTRAKMGSHVYLLLKCHKMRKNDL